MSSFPVKRKRGRVNLSWAKTDCKACMHVKRRQDGKWIVSSFIKDHNHEIFPDHECYLGNNNNNNNSDAIHAIRERTRKMFATMSRRSGGWKKVENIKDRGSNGRHLGFDEGDLQALLDYFVCMQDENPNFFYAIDFNEEQQLRSVFWVDAKGRLDYRHFSDVVLFDTMHVKNEYRLPFIAFIGVNHHFQFMLLGLALVSDESSSTYMWLMQAWFRAMGGLAPKVMLTDQDNALKEAVAQVLPDSCHCYCLWHVLSKIPEKLGHVSLQHANFMIKFNKCVLRSGTSEQFEKRWWKMVERFNLGDDNWLCSIYEDRERWIPAYMRDIFLAGMSTMQRSESINCLLDKYVQRKTTLKEFLEQYKVMLRDKCEEEAKADFETLHKQPTLKSPSPFGKQMVKLYTHAIFKKFQIEVLGVVACHPRKESEDGPTKMFRVQDFEDNQEFIVVWNESMFDASCSCYSFEFNGFLCRHVMIVLQISGIHNIPSQYILKRWTKDAKNRQTARELSSVVHSRVKRYNNLCTRAFELGDEGSLSHESYIFAVNALEEALRKCESLNDSIQNVIEPNSPIFGSQEVIPGNNAGHKSKKSSTFKKRQVCPEPEIIAIGINSSWQQMDPNTRAAGFDCSYESQHSIQEMDQLSTRTQNLDGYYANPQIDSGLGQLNLIAAVRNDYYSNQHGPQGLGHLNSIASTHDAHYMAPQRMHGMAQLHFRQAIPSCFNVLDTSRNVDQPNGGSTQLHGMGVNVKQLNSRHRSQ
ncbi:protein FAR-RED IMPAIRED RESPONSE 1-like [Gastrolobium bilobum]|uniref:protein FAR-RED IMPAIRED RESPONSE 1-like n=1 Tax=Gastrolobium bilobum TaxID=150636 RepID=UPI002AB1DB3B|nr:protein FAR-RED IMPAIRED RESPONSE 1-like [Gastrolobium bilobum]